MIYDILITVPERLSKTGVQYQPVTGCDCMLHVVERSIDYALAACVSLAAGWVQKIRRELRDQQPDIDLDADPQFFTVHVYDQPEPGRPDRNRDGLEVWVYSQEAIIWRENTAYVVMKIREAT